MTDFEQNFSPENIATLLDLAKKLESRKSRQAISGAVVKRHDWTKEERNLNAAKNDIRSAQFAYEKTRIAMERAEEAFSYAEQDLINAERRLREAIAAVKESTEE